MNNVVLMGRLTADRELKQTPSGVSSCRFNLAVNRRFADKNTGERQADFISCIAWRQTAEFVCKYFKKGQMLALSGSIRTGKYQDKLYPEITHYTTDVLVDNVEFCGGKNDTAQDASQGSGSHSYSSEGKHTDNNTNAANSGGFDGSLGDMSNDFEEILSDGDVPF